MLFFGVALLYSSVGFGGGSSYLAILALFELNFTFLRAVALLCNVTVVSHGSYQYYRKGFLKLKKILPLVVSSVPMAFIGGKMLITERTFFIVLGFTLLVAAVLIWFQPKLKALAWDFSKISENTFFNVSIGGLIGFLSGLVGIGGGIFLSPILFIINWDKPKVIAGTASFFILVNSLSGLLGQFQNKSLNMDWPFALALMTSVGIGGLVGTYVGTVKFNHNKVRIATGVLIAYVAINLLQKYI